MPRRKKRSNGKAVLVLVLIGIIAVGVIAWHDGLIGTTSIRDINQGDVSRGTLVTIKGVLTGRLGSLHTVTMIGETNTVAFLWDGTSPPVDSIIVVRGAVGSIITLENVTSVAIPWIFA